MRFVRSCKNKSRVCRVINISRSNIYYKRKAAKEDMYEKIVLEIFDKHNSNYGCRRIQVEMKAMGKRISKRRIGKLLRKNDRESKHGRKKLAKNIHTAIEERYIAENLIKGKTATRPHEICQMDATQFKCKDGKLFACGIIDIYDKRVVIDTGLGERKELVCATIRKRIEWGTPAIIHSDRGPANVSKAVKELLEKSGIKRSMSAPYRPNENQYIETFWKTLKTEIGETKHRTREELTMILEYYVNYYNTERIHSSIGYITPQQKYLTCSAA